MPVEEDNLHSIVSLIQMVGLLRGSSSTRESSLLSTKLYYWEDQSLECSKIQLDYLQAGLAEGDAALLMRANGEKCYNLPQMSKICIKMSF